MAPVSLLAIYDSLQEDPTMMTLDQALLNLAQATNTRH